MRLQTMRRKKREPAKRMASRMLNLPVGYGEVPEIQLSVKGRIFMELSRHYEQKDGSCECGWKPTSREYPDRLHFAHLAVVVEKALFGKKV